MPDLNSSRTSFKRPESVLVVVMTVAGEVLLLERAEPNGFWQSVTGSMAWGEAPRDAALRELYEETGLRAGGGLIDLRQHVDFPIVPPWRARYAPSAHVNREHWFALWLPGRRLIRRNGKEHVKSTWLSANRAVLRASSWTNRKAIRQMLSFGF